MKKSKEQNWFKENIESMVIALIILFLIIYGIPKYLNSTNYICSKNLDKCVIELRNDIPKNLRPIKEQYSNWNDYCLRHKPFNKDFCKLRLKTQAELDIQSCQENPREDDKCKCEEYKNGFSCGGFPISITKTFQNQTELDEYIYNYRHKSEEVNECPFFPILITYFINRSNNIDFVTEEQKLILDKFQINYKVIHITATDSSSSQKYKSWRECTKSHPKTECEKGNPDWVEETEILTYSCISKYKTIKATYNKIGSYSETWNKNLHIYYCNSDFETKCSWMDCSDENAGKISCMKQLFESDKRIEENDFYNGTCQVTQKTICREKTLEEKQFEEVCKRTINYKVKD